MAKEKQISILRTKTENELKQFISEKNKSGLVYFRGRRRVGKTTLLMKLEKEHSNVFYFVGASDESNRETLGRFSSAWGEFSGQSILLKYKKTELNWQLCFDQITNYAKENKSKIITVIFDEIQWLAKSRSGFVGTIKANWIEWEKTQNIKLIICGSSNKFFVDQTGGEEKILRGLKTWSDIILLPITAAEVRTYYFPDWSVDEVLMLYMMIGGVPYYLNQIPREYGFIRALNEAFFTKKTIFLSEVDEIINLEFNKAGAATIKKILNAIGIFGATFAHVAVQLKISSGGLFEAINKLVEYFMLKEKALFSSQEKRKSGTIYFYDDPYLLFYFACLEKMRVAIEENEKQLLIANLIGSDKSLYIANFSGRAFEMYLRNLLTSTSNDQQRILLDALGIPDRDFELYDCLSKQDPGDFILIHRKLRTHFVLECKWTQSLEIIKEGISQLLKFNSDDNDKATRIERALITNYKPSNKIKEFAKASGVKFVWIEEIGF